MTREDILGAADQVFRQKGCDGASMADLASVVNLEKASPYHHDSSKQEKLLSLLDRALETLAEGIAPLANQSIPSDKKLRLMNRVYLQPLAVIRELNLDWDKVNVNGSAIALGHPLGCTGAKLTTQLLFEMGRRGSRYGMVMISIGGGMGTAATFDNLQ